MLLLLCCYCCSVTVGLLLLCFYCWAVSVVLIPLYGQQPFHHEGSLCSCYAASLIASSPPHRALLPEQVVDDYSSKSFRLLAMAVGVIPRAAKLKLMHMTQQQIEGSAVNMHLLSLVVLTNNVRSDSKATITQLQEG